MRLAPLAVALCLPGLPAQTPEEIADAIKRLDGPKEDARAIEFLIDAGEPAVDQILGILRAEDDEVGARALRRMLRVLRCVDVEATESCVTLGHLTSRLTSHAGAGATRETGRRLSFGEVGFDLMETTGRIVWRHQGGLDRVREAWTLASFQAAIYGELAQIRLCRGLFFGSESSEPALSAVDVFGREAWAVSLTRGGKEEVRQLRLLAVASDQPQRVLMWRTDEGGSFTWMLPQDVANRIVTDAAVRAIARIEPSHPDAVRGLALMVADADDPRDRVKAAAALGRHGGNAAGFVDVLVKALDSHDDRLVAEAATSLGMIGVASEVVLARLRALSQDERPNVAKRAEAAVRVLERR